MEQWETLRWSVQNGVGVIELYRPERLNALNAQMKHELARLLEERARKDEDVRVLLITGAGEKAFCVGADIKEKASEDVSPSTFFRTQRTTHELFRKLEEFEKPTIAAINGLALGGGLEIALCCDIRLAATSARFGLPEAKLGVIPAAGGTQRLPRLVGESLAKQMIFTAAMWDASRALQVGLVNEVVDTFALREHALIMAQGMAELPPLALRMAKRCINRGMQTDIDSGLEYERYAASILMDTQDRKEGMRAFVEKRAPVFTGN
ncbi:enoyl-CoA hydratase/isomerase family protein [Comamonas sp. C11]|uniref:enoyl-CoA hydratase/isomerase family protein n=1 Tax=Comamonas sp. C11 TaxID=2966554 RepID=UPI002113318E|nr:enoyl-CoA hydratase-related protein [Comamonas sp. C11]UUC96740.1 enoyl-CoA hydratase-related protein [Comamonas sp. C11]